MLIVLALALVVIALAAVRYGVDSRDTGLRPAGQAGQRPGPEARGSLGADLHRLQGTLRRRAAITVPTEPRVVPRSR